MSRYRALVLSQIPIALLGAGFCYELHRTRLALEKGIKMKHIEEQMILEGEIDVIKRGTLVNRVSELYNNITVFIKVLPASLQHLFFRYLLEIGDSGFHNVLLRNDESENLIAGSNQCSTIDGNGRV